MRVICGIHDTCSDSWLSPMFWQTRRQAVRAFKDVIADKNTEFARHPEDYNLFSLGTFDEQSGAVVGAEPVLVCSGVSLLSELEELRHEVA